MIDIGTHIETAPKQNPSNDNSNECLATTLNNESNSTTESYLHSADANEVSFSRANEVSNENSVADKLNTVESLLKIFELRCKFDGIVSFFEEFDKIVGSREQFL